MQVNIEEVTVVKANVWTQSQKMLIMKAPEVKTPLACRSQAIRASKKSPVTVTSPSVKTDIVIKTEKVERNEDVKVIGFTNNGEDDVDPMDMSIYKDVISNSSKYTSSKNAKKCIQVFVSNLLHHKTDEDKNENAVTTNFCECIWYMKSDLLFHVWLGWRKLLCL